MTVPGIAFEDLPPIDAVLLSHCHYDHLDVATLRRLQADHAPLMAMPVGNDTIVRAAVPEARCIVGDWWDRMPLGEGFATTLTPAYHWANRWPSDVRMALWAGHHLTTPAGSVWFAGDTGYGDGVIFRDMRERLGAPDVALIPIGAYELRWFMSAQHVNPAEAVRIFKDVDAGQALGIHWGTFQLTDEARDAPRLALASALLGSRPGHHALRSDAARCRLRLRARGRLEHFQRHGPARPREDVVQPREIGVGEVQVRRRAVLANVSRRSRLGNGDGPISRQQPGKRHLRWRDAALTCDVGQSAMRASRRPCSTGL